VVILSVLIYVGASICKSGFEDQCGQHMPTLSIGDLTTAGTLVTFFLTFYTTTCYSRFTEQYTHLKDIEGTMRAIAIKVRMYYHLPALKKDIVVDSNVVQFKTIELFRYLGGAYYLLFARLYEGEEKEFNLRSAHEEGLITQQEMDHLHSSTPGMRWFRMLCWAFQVVKEIEATPTEGELDKEDLKDIAASILAMRAAMNAVSYQAQMPIPFPYYHIITLLTFGFIIPYSYACAFISSSVSLAWIVWIVPVFGFAGMREVAMDMADPFGDDDTDLPVDVYVHNIMKFLVDFVEENLRPTVAKEGRDFHEEKEWAEKHTQCEEAKKKIQQTVHNATQIERKQNA